MRKIKVVEVGIKFKAMNGANFDKNEYEITNVVRGRHGEVTVSWNDGANSVNYSMVEAKNNLLNGNWQRIPSRLDLNLIKGHGGSRMMNGIA